VFEGTVKVAPLNAPVLLVLVVPDKVTVVAPNFAVKAEPEAKPLPDKETDVPMIPVAGDGEVMLAEGDGAAKASIAPTQGLEEKVKPA
jgi:hypothetical protein